MSRKPREHRGRRGEHGLTRGGAIPPLYRIWVGIKVRCYMKTSDDYNAYGDRGITVCDRWLNGDGERSGFECFSVDMGARPSPRHSLNRSNNDGNYEPGNCVWATAKEQARNNRHNRWVTIKGEEILIGDAIEKHSPIGFTSVYRRIQKGWPVEAAILTPPRGRNF